MDVVCPSPSATTQERRDDLQDSGQKRTWASQVLRVLLGGILL